MKRLQLAHTTALADMQALQASGDKGDDDFAEDEMNICELQEVQENARELESRETRISKLIENEKNTQENMSQTQFDEMRRIQI